MRSGKHSKQFVRIIWDSSVWTAVQKKHVPTQPWECPLTFPTAHQNKTWCTAFLLTSLTTSPHTCRRKAQVCCVVIFSSWIPNPSDTQNRILGNGRKKMCPAIQKYSEGQKRQDEIQPKDKLRVSWKDAVIFLPPKCMPETGCSLGSHESERLWRCKS